MLVLLFVALWFILRGDFFYVSHCVNLFLCFSVLLVLRLSRLGNKKASLGTFRTFVLFALVCLFPVPLGVWEGLWFVIVALPGLFICKFMLLYNKYLPLFCFSPIIFSHKNWVIYRKKMCH